MVYNTSLFDRETVEQLLALYVRVLEVMSVTPEVGVSDFELVTGAQRERVLSELVARTRQTFVDALAGEELVHLLEDLPRAGALRHQ